MMEKILLIRERLCGLYGRYSMVILPCARFLVMFGALCVMRGNIGFSSISSLPVLAAVSLVGAWLPAGIRVFMAAVMVLLNLYSLSLEVAAAMACMMVLMFCVNYVIKPEKNHLILLLPVCYYLGIPYAPVLLTGLTGSLLEVVPVAFSTIIYYTIVYIGKNTTVFSSASSLTMVEKFVQAVSGVVGNQKMWLSCLTLCAILIVTRLVSRLKADYSRRIGIGVGIATGVMIMLFSIFVFSIRLSVPLLIVGYAVSGLIAFAVDFMILPLNYLQTEYAQFEDDDYYYYVKAVPKMAISRPEVQIKKLNIRKELENTATIPDVSAADRTDELPGGENR